MITGRGVSPLDRDFRQALVLSGLDGDFQCDLGDRATFVAQGVGEVAQGEGEIEHVVGAVGASAVLALGGGMVAFEGLLADVVAVELGPLFSGE
jgi:hypothetical protein